MVHRKYRVSVCPPATTVGDGLTHRARKWYALKIISCEGGQMHRCAGHRVPETAQYCRKINPSEPEYEIRDLHNSAGIRIFTRARDFPLGLLRAFSEVDVIGGKILRRTFLFRNLEVPDTSCRINSLQELNL